MQFISQEMSGFEFIAYRMCNQTKEAKNYFRLKSAILSIYSFAERLIKLSFH